MRVVIIAGGREVQLECGETGTSYRELADKALEVWNGTASAKDSLGPAYGFVASQAGDRSASSTTRGRIRRTE